MAGSREVLLVTAVATNTLTITRALWRDDEVAVGAPGGAGDPGQRGAGRGRCGGAAVLHAHRRSNYTQIFSAALQVSGSEAAVRQVQVADEMDYQKTLRLRELLRDLENTVINGVAPEATTEGSSTVRRTLRGILAGVTTNQLALNSGYIPSDTALTEAHLNAALRTVWEVSGSKPDLILCGGGAEAGDQRADPRVAAVMRRATSDSRTW